MTAPWCSASSPGAADELKQAYRVNPYDINGLKSAMLEAMGADARERGRRMRAMRKQVLENDIAKWADSFLTDLGKDPDRKR